MRCPHKYLAALHCDYEYARHYWNCIERDLCEGVKGSAGRGLRKMASRISPNTTGHAHTAARSTGIATGPACVTAARSTGIATGPACVTAARSTGIATGPACVTAARSTGIATGPACVTAARSTGIATGPACVTAARSTGIATGPACVTAARSTGVATRCNVAGICSGRTGILGVLAQLGSHIVFKSGIGDVGTENVLGAAIYLRWRRDTDIRVLFKGFRDTTNVFSRFELQEIIDCTVFVNDPHVPGRLIRALRELGCLALLQLDFPHRLTVVEAVND